MKHEFCTSCGHKMEYNFAPPNFCSKCGAPVGGVSRAKVVKTQQFEEAVEEVGQVAEGVNTVRLVAQKAEEKAVYMPLATGLYKILYEQHSIESIISSLMLGDQALDVEFAAHSEKVLIEE